MKNLPLLISFIGGAGGRFIQHCLSHLIDNTDLPTLTNDGAAHGELLFLGQPLPQWVLLLHNDYNDSLQPYHILFKNSISKFYSEFGDKNDYTIDMLLSMIRDINESPYHSARSQLIAEYCNKLKYSNVVRSHVTNIIFLRELNRLLHTPFTNILITINSTEDIIVSRLMSSFKNGHATDTSPSNAALESIARTKIKGNSHPLITSLNGVVEQENEFFLPFKHIRLKDTEYLLAFFSKIMHHCNVQPEERQWTNVTKFIEKYFSFQRDYSQYLL